MGKNISVLVYLISDTKANPDSACVVVAKYSRNCLHTLQKTYHVLITLMYSTLSKHTFSFTKITPISKKK